MVLTNAELIASFQNEVRILLHLARKVDHASVDYRPTPKQRSTLELLRYLAMMGPELIATATSGAFDVPAWNAAEAAVGSMTLGEAIAAIDGHTARYAAMLGEVTDDQLRAEVDIFGGKTSRGAFIVNQVLCACAAYRTQLFLYLKSCGREELSTWNLWAGMDAPPQA